MALLAYQSTGVEARDAEIINVRLQENKRVAVQISSIREDVERLLREKFGEVEFKSIQQIGHDRCTGIYLWQVDIFRDPAVVQYKKIGMPPVNTLQEDEGDEAKEVAVVPNELRVLVSQFHAAMLGAARPQMHDVFVRNCAEEIHRQRKRYSERNNRIGAIAELIGATHTKQIIRCSSLPLRPMVFDDLRQSFPSQHFSAGPLPDQLVFLDRSREAILEVDMLCEASPIGYIGVDFTVASSKKTGAAKCDVLLEVAQSHLKKPLVLLNVFLSAAKEFVLRPTANLVYRMHMPHNLNFNELTERSQQ